MTPIPLLLLSLAASAAPVGYYRSPSLRGDRIAFVAEGDLWTVATAGGRARRLTTHLAAETTPALSPDGAWLAFAAAYEGPPEVYVMPVAGGLPRRITFGGERTAVAGWTPGGEVLHVTAAPEGPAGRTVLAAVSPATGQRTVFPLADARDGCLGVGGRVLYFTRLGLETTGDNARGYRGGAMAQLWRWELGSDREAVRLQQGLGGSARRPMCDGGRVYFLSDRDGVDNLYSVDEAGEGLRQHTRETAWDVRSPSLDGGRVAYQRGADLRLLDLASGADRAVEITLESDLDQQRVRFLKKPLDFLTSVALAPAGDRVAVTARGRVALAAAGPLRRVDVRLPPEARAREAVVGPDGKWVYAICDATGEEEVWRFPADGGPGGKALTHGDGALLVGLHPSPDGRWLAYHDRRGRLWLLDLQAGKSQQIDRDEVDGEYGAIRWSHDGKTLALVRVAGASERPRIGLYSLEQRRLRFVTSDRYPSGAPAFSPDGRWLYFWSNRTFQSSEPDPWGDRNLGGAFDRRGKVYALALQPGLASPWKPRDELDPAPPPAGGKAEKEGKAEARPLPAIAWEGLEERLWEVPLEPGNYVDLQADDKRLYLLERPGRRTDGERFQLRTLAADGPDARPELLVADVRSFALSADGKKLLYRTWVKEGPGELFLVEAGAKLPEELRKAPPDTSRSLVRLGDWSVELDPRAEWRQMFRDAWRRHRELLFDRAMRGLDWEAVRRKYQPLLERITERGELDDLLAMMVGELGVLHSQVVPGELRAAQDAQPPASLGAAFSRVEEGYRVERIYRTEAELPSERGPLQAPGVDVREGDVLLAVNGAPAAAARDLSDLLRGRAGQQVLLSVRRGREAPRPAVVAPVDAARGAALRHGDWEESRRARVEQAGKGRIGYLHLRAMAADNFATFVREFYASVERDGLVLDLRRNRGGNVDSWVLEKLLRRVWAFWAPVGRRPFLNQPQTFRGHLVVLVDEGTYSDGETLAAGIRALRLGTLVGKRTAGAGVWLSDGHPLADRGRARVAEFPWFTTDGQWMVEGLGVAPDVEVESPPHATFRGEDAQLEAALAILEEKLLREPVPPLRPGAMPRR